jgi:2'-5' RNA ligase
MLLRAAAIPPPEASERIAAVVGSAVSPGSGLTPIPADRLHVVMAQFGNLPTDEVPRLLDTLSEAMADLGDAPTLHLGGGTIADERSHQVVETEIRGDVQRLTEVAGDLAMVVTTRRLFVDRRRFHPAMPVVTLDPGTPPEAAAGVIAALDRYEESAWTLSGLSLMRGSWAGEEKALGPVYEEHDHFPFVG